MPFEKIDEKMGESRFSASAYLVAGLLTTFLAACGGGGEGQSSGGATGWLVLTGASTSHTEAALASDDVVNPGRGYYRWDSQEEVPQKAAAPDWYRRYTWKALETSEDVYDFSVIAQDLQTARNNNRKFALRIQMMLGYGDGKKYVPDYVVGHANCSQSCGFDSTYGTSGTYVPDWNDTWLQQRGRKLLEKLRAFLVNQNALSMIGWMDVGFYGQYGEWTINSNVYTSAPAGISATTEASKQAWARMHFEVFPEVRHVMFALHGNLTALQWGFNQTITQQAVGLRIDCMAQGSFFDQWTNRPNDYAVIKDRWKVAPLIAEFCPFESGNTGTNPAHALQQARDYHVSLIGNGNFALSRPVGQRYAALTASEQADMLALGREVGYRYAWSQSTVSVGADGVLRLQAQLRNAGNSPTYEAWQVAVHLYDGQGQSLASSNVTLKLQDSVGNGSLQSVDHTWALPALAKGDYTLRIRATRSDRNRPLAWANAARNADGSLTIATLRY